MSTDFCNFVAALPAPTARAWLGRLEPDERLAELVGPDEQTLALVERGVALDLAAVRRAYAGERPAPRCYGSTYVDVDPGEWIERLTQEAPDHGFVVSMGDPILVALDRVLALPRGIQLLAGHGVARLRPKRRAKVALRWRSLVARLGGPRGVVAKMAPHLRDGGSYAGCREMLAELDRVLTAAEAEDRDVLMFVTPS